MIYFSAVISGFAVSSGIRFLQAENENNTSKQSKNATIFLLIDSKLLYKFCDILPFFF